MTAAYRRLLREPLVHFLAAGAVLFTAYALVRGPAAAPADETTIVVDRRALLTYMQYRANAFEPDTFAAALDAMSAAELQQFIDAYVDEEILYREAKSLGLAESDFVIRQRMIQKIDFLLGDIAGAGTDLDESELLAYFNAHKDAYAIEPAVTFAHVFFDADRRGAETALTDALEAVRTLNASGAEFNDAPRYGDRFPFLTNYVERTFDFVASHFGTEFAAELANMSPSVSIWQGPIRSAYGQHVVLLTQRTQRRFPTLDEVRDGIERDYLDERAAADRANMIANLRQRYSVEIGDLRLEQ
jgi:hypothetical protein